MSENAAVKYYFVDAQGSRNGPINEADFIAAISAGSISPETPVWRTGEAEWSPLKIVRKTWFPEEITAVPALERLNADTSLASLFNATWNFLFSGNNFWFLLCGGILWWLIEIAASSVVGNLSTIVTSFIAPLVFLVFLRKWDRGEAPGFSDIFPLKRFFFLPWLRTLVASIVAGITGLVPVFIAGTIGTLSIIAVNSAKPELGERLERLEQTCLYLAETLNQIENANELPQISVETEHEPDEILPEAESVEVTFSNNEALTDAIKDSPELSETIAEDLEKIAEILFASPIFLGSLAFSALLFTASVFLFTRFAFVSYFPLDAEIGIVNSLKYSWKLTAGRFWKIFTFGILLGILFLVGTVVTLGIGYIVLCPYVFAAFPVLYAKLIKARPELQIPTSRL